MGGTNNKPGNGVDKGSLRGFTLIELAIVLVVIGLVVGGVLVGRDLVNAATMRAQLSQIEQLNTGVATFRDKYGGIPGDLPIPLANQFGFLTPADCTGQVGGRDGNGLIDGTASPDSLAALMGENVLFWMDLSAANLGGNTIPSTSTYWGFNPNCSNSINATGTQIPLPRGKLGYNTFIHVYETRGRNWFQLANITSFSSATSTVNGAVTIPVLQSYNIDNKIDDGIPDKGTVQAVYIVGQNATTTAPHAAADSSTTCYNTATTPSAYSLTYNNGVGTNCALSFRFQ